MRRTALAFLLLLCVSAGQANAVGSPSVVLSFLGKTIKTGDKITIAATTVNGTDSGYDWSSNNYSVARIEGDGVIVGVSAGTAIVTATGKTTQAVGSAVITVVEITNSTSVEITPDNPSLYIGKVLKITAATTPFIEENYTWLSADDGVVAVDSSGNLTAMTAGSALVYATGQTSQKIGSVVVNVLPGGNVAVNISPSDRKLKTGETVQFLAATKDNGVDFFETYLWQSSNTAILTVLSDGTVTARSAGTARLSALGAASGYLGQISVTVEDSSDFYVEKIIPVLAGGGLGVDCFLLLANPASTSADVELQPVGADGISLGSSIKVTLGSGKKQILRLENPNYFTNSVWNVSIPQGTFYSLKIKTKQTALTAVGAVIFNAADRGDVLVIEPRTALPSTLRAPWRNFESYVAVQNASVADAPFHVKFFSSTGGVLLDETVSVSASGLNFIGLNSLLKDRSASWLEISSGGSLTAQFFFIDNAGNWNSFPMESAAPNSAVISYLPASASGITPVFSLVNPGAVDLTLSGDVYNSRGEKLAKTASLTLQAKTAQETSLTLLWPAIQIPDNGFVTVNLSANGAWSLLPAAEDSTKNSFRVFSASGMYALSANAVHVSTGDALDTALSLRNPNATPATVSLILLGDDGVSSTTVNTMLSGGETRYQSLSDWFGQESSLAGRLRIESNLSVTGAIFGSVTNGSRIMPFEMPLFSGN